MALTMSLAVVAASASKRQPRRFEP
jgi:hypothetical protein